MGIAEDQCDPFAFKVIDISSSRHEVLARIIARLKLVKNENGKRNHAVPDTLNIPKRQKSVDAASTASTKFSKHMKIEPR